MNGENKMNSYVYEILGLLGIVLILGLVVFLEDIVNWLSSKKENLVR